MNRSTNRRILLIAAAGGAAAIHSTASAQYVINQSGATLLENFLKSPAASNDYFDVDGDGIARIFGTNDQLAPSNAAPPPAKALGANASWWIVCYRATGSVNGFQELVDFGGPGFITTADNVDLFSTSSSKSFYNRLQYVSSGAPSNAVFNAGNPGGYPVRSHTTTLEATYASPPNPASGGIRMDMAPVDVPSLWAVQNTGGSAAFHRLPGQGGYGTNPRLSVNTSGGSAGAGGVNTLAALGPRNLFDENNPGAADANTIFDIPIAFAPIAAMTNLGTGMSEMRQSELRHLYATGRLMTGENLVAVTRDSGSGTRNGFINSLCLDPSFGIGDNVGPYGALVATTLLGPDFTPNHKLGSGEMEATVINHRLAIGYSGAERGVNSGWLTGGRAEVLAVQNDLQGGTEYSRPNIDEILDNNANGYTIGGPAIFASIGDPKAAPASKGGSSNGRPAMLNVEAAAYLNNVTLSIAAFTSAPGGSASLFTPGEYLADNYTLVAATDFIQDKSDPCNLIPNPGLNQALQNFTRTDSTLGNPVYSFFGSVTLNGKIPTRKTGVSYSDASGGDFYRTQGGGSLFYGSDLNDRNRICGDFNGDAVRDINDAFDLVAAHVERSGGPAWAAPNGTGAIAGAAGSGASIEILGDFNGDGSFSAADVRFWADGLAMDPSCGGLLHRYRGFKALDDHFGGNLFGTTKATGAPHASGDSAGDVAGPGGNQAPGFAPVGADGAIDAHDIDYVYKQFRQNPNVTDGELNWDSTAEAVDGDLSADINGDLVINQRDVCFLVGTILGTSIGDVNLDGFVDGSDAAIAAANLDQAGGWADGDVDGDGTVTSADQDIIAGAFNPCCPADFNGDLFVDGIDYDTFNNLFEAGDCRVDINLDGFVDGIDYDTFNNLFETPC